MKTAVIGFPRIGALRELKFSSEKYFRNEITEEELIRRIIRNRENLAKNTLENTKRGRN